MRVPRSRSPSAPLRRCSRARGTGDRGRPPAPRRAPRRADREELGRAADRLGRARRRDGAGRRVLPAGRRRSHVASSTRRSSRSGGPTRRRGSRARSSRCGSSTRSSSPPQACSPSARAIRLAARDAGLEPTDMLGTETVARLLGLRVNHRSAARARARAKGAGLAGGGRVLAREAPPARPGPGHRRPGVAGDVRGPGARDVAAASWSRGRFVSSATRTSSPARRRSGRSCGARRRPASTITAPGGFDCSGLVWRVYKLEPFAVRRSLGDVLKGRTTYAMSGEVGKALRVAPTRCSPATSCSSARKGPKSKPAEIGHTGIYVGNGWFVHSSSGGVTLQPLQGWYATSARLGTAPARRGRARRLTGVESRLGGVGSRRALEAGSGPGRHGGPPRPGGRARRWRSPDPDGEGGRRARHHRARRLGFCSAATSSAAAGVERLSPDSWLPAGARAEAGSQPEASDDLFEFTKFVSQDAQDMWTKIFGSREGSTRARPSSRSRAGPRAAAGRRPPRPGPFYCPADHKVYLDLWVLPGALRSGSARRATSRQAYVIAHEIGHHVQSMLGIEADGPAEAAGGSRQREPVPRAPRAPGRLPRGRVGAFDVPARAAGAGRHRRGSRRGGRGRRRPARRAGAPSSGLTGRRGCGASGSGRASTPAT